MGWTSYKVRTPFSIKSELDNEFTHNNGTTSWRVLKSAVKSGNGYREYYAAIERIKDSERMVYGVVCLCEVRGGEFYYKDMDETMEPYYYNCPEAILKLLTATDNEHANKWRATCREKIDMQNRIKKVFDTNKTIKLKALADMSYGSREIKVGDVVTAERYKTYYIFQGYGAWCRIRKQDIGVYWDIAE